MASTTFKFKVGDIVYFCNNPIKLTIIEVKLENSINIYIAQSMDKFYTLNENSLSKDPPDTPDFSDEIIFLETLI